MNQQNTPKKNQKGVNRTLYIVTVTMLFAIAVIIAITSASNRSRKENLGNPETDMSESSFLTPEDTEKQKETQPKDTQPSPKDTTPPKVNSDVPEEPTPVVEKIPEFALPISGILSKEHSLETQVFSQTMQDYRTHSGIDISAGDKAPVYAAADGVIEKISYDPLMGYTIEIRHSGNCSTIYSNLSEEPAEGICEGAEICVGQAIATIGESAMVEIAEEPHLHFEIKVGGVSVNPLDYLDESALVSLESDTKYES